MMRPSTHSHTRDREVLVRTDQVTGDGRHDGGDRNAVSASQLGQRDGLPLGGKVRVDVVALDEHVPITTGDPVVDGSLANR
jgi:hypothetical protein